MLASIAIRRNSGVFCAEVCASCVAAVCAKSSSHCATSTGEYLPLRSPLSSSSANPLTVENNCGSNGLALPNVLGAGVSLYGVLLGVAIGCTVNISGQ